MKADDKSDRGALRRRAEARFKEKPPAADSAGPEDEVRRLVHELQVHQIELEMQNEELQQGQLRAEEAAARYMELYDFAPVGYFTLDRVGIIGQANLAGARLLGLDRAAVKGRPLRQFVSGDSMPAFDSFFEMTGRTDQCCQVSLDKGAGAPLEVIFTAALSDSGNQRFIAAVDITERKLLELALEKMSGSLRRKNAELSDFLYISSHDLRSPLVNIQGFSRNIVRDCEEIASLLDVSKTGREPGKRVSSLLSQSIPEALKYVSSSVARMDSLIAGLLKMSRVGCVELKPQIVDMNKLLEEAARGLAFQFAEAKAELRVDKLPPCQADPAQLAQVILNLLDNAVKYRSPDRKPVITVSGKILRPGGSCYVISDNGKGFASQEEAENIWTLFYRGDEKSGTAGEGVGLTISRLIVERHGGSIKARPLPGGGAEFTLELPNPGLEGEKAKAA
jgi:PAS domain S-box-containing protein